MRWVRTPLVLLGCSNRTLRLYVVLAAHADKDGLAWPSLRRLEAEVKCRRENVLAGLAELEGLGIITVEHGNFTAAKPNKYRLVSGSRTATDTGSPTDTHTGSPAGTGTGSPNGASPVARGLPELERATREGAAQHIPGGLRCSFCGLDVRTERRLAEHVENVHYDQVGATL